jgi:Holliday junction DNA helicase RuvA
MISFLGGKLIAKTVNAFVILTGGGIGYEVRVLPTMLDTKKVGDDVEFFTYLKVSENAMDLYGFADVKQKEFFEILISVSGVGPKSALHILTLGSLTEIQSAIARGDVSYLTQVSGIGKKTAERMIVELKSKLSKMADKGEIVKDSGILGEVVDALVSLGYSKVEAREAVKKLKNTNKSSEALLREALKFFK